MKRIEAVLGGAVCVLAMPALAVPPALDRVPEDAALVVAVENLQQFHDEIKGFADLFGIQPLREPLQMAGQLLGTEGLNAQGSVAMVLLAGEGGVVEQGQEPRMVVVAPVSDFEAMAQGVGGEQAEGLLTFEMDGETVYAKPIGEGYAVMSPSAEVARAFAGEGGHSGAHERRLGQSGRRAAEGADVVAIVNVPAFAPMIRAAGAEMQNNMAMMGAMMGEQGKGFAQMGQMLAGMVETLAEDGQSAVLALEAGEGGLELDAAAQFRAGSDAAETLSVAGKARELLSHVPDTEFLFAGAMDVSNPKLKGVMMELAKASQEMNPEQAQAMGFMNFGRLSELQDGSAFLMGDPPALMMGGLWNKTVTYTKTSDPGGLVEETAKATREMDGVSVEGITFNTSYEAGALQVEGVNVDRWSMRMSADPDNPMGGQMAMQFNMMFGPMGLQGYTAQVEGGTVTMMSQNAEFMASALRAAKEGNGLGRGDRLAGPAGRLPESTVAEVYIGVGPLMRQGMNMAAMFGQPMQMDLPERIEPVGMGVATGEGGVQGRLVVPQSVLETISQIQRQMGGGMAPGAAPPAEGNPRF